MKAARDEVKAKAGEIKVLEDQLSKAKEQLGSAQMTIASMVSRSELTAAEALLNELHLLMRANEEKSRKSVDCLQEQAREYKSEIDELKAAIQATCDVFYSFDCIHHRPFSNVCVVPFRREWCPVRNCWLQGVLHPSPF